MNETHHEYKRVMSHISMSHITHMNESCDTHTHACARTHTHTHTHFCTLHRKFNSLPQCCSVLQCVAVCCSVLQRVAACCSVLQQKIQLPSSRGKRAFGSMCVCVFVYVCVCVCMWLCNLFVPCTKNPTPFLSVAVCCSVLQCVAVCCSVLQRVAVCLPAQKIQRPFPL